MHALANPARFTVLARRLAPWLGGLAIVLTGIGLYLALLGSPPDYQQGETVRIMYVHVPAAWMALFVYACMAAASVAGLVWKTVLAELACKAMAPIGAAFTAICLITGSLWGAPMWGTWWVWDARLTSVLLLFFLYLGYLALVNAFDEPGRGLKAGGILVLVGVVNLPIIKFSVDWWNTLHQPASVSRIGVPAIDPAMLAPLLVMAAAFMAFFASVALLRIRAEILERRLQALRFAQAAAAVPAAGRTGMPAGAPGAAAGRGA
ncbi:MAG: heme transporter HemC [Alphaproteobacteria bacterium]|jgi:heme exporter protein C|nr:heme transporter HemC [Alphaproteobacteria bacterium]